MDWGRRERGREHRILNPMHVLRGLAEPIFIPHHTNHQPSHPCLSTLPSTTARRAFTSESQYTHLPPLLLLILVLQNLLQPLSLLHLLLFLRAHRLALPCRIYRLALPLPLPSFRRQCISRREFGVLGGGGGERGGIGGRAVGVTGGEGGEFGFDSVAGGGAWRGGSLGQLKCRKQGGGMLTGHDENCTRAVWHEQLSFPPHR